MNIAIQLDIPKERVRSVLSSYYMSTLPEEYQPALHVSFPQEDLVVAQQILQSDNFDGSGVFRRPEPRTEGGVRFETSTGRKKLRRIEASCSWRIELIRIVVNYCRNFWQLPSLMVANTDY